ncbi:MAG TPA: fatty acyl-AMP ligase [Vicinamibacterales bacterium]|nr:fatty acyl-AMP ligase [Vicinamibacterales bacterium]
MNPRPTIGDALVAAAASPFGLRFIEHDGRALHLPYTSLMSDACRIGGALQSRGLVVGDHVALVVPEISGFAQAFFGIVAAGLVPVPLCPPAQAGDILTFQTQSRHIVDASRAKAIVSSEDVAALLRADGGTRPPIFVLADLQNGPALDAPVAQPPDATALLQFTSGSTALPKGVVLSHGNIGANVEAILGPSGLDARPGDVAVSWLPLYHDMGLIGMLLSSVYAPADAVILSPVLFLKRPSAWLDAISTYKGTVSFAPNFAYELCRRRVKTSQLEALDLSRWRVAGCGAEPIRPDTLLQFAEYFAPAGFRATSFLPSYGLAEHSLAVTFAHGGLMVDIVDADRLVRESRAVPVVNGSPAVRVVRCGRGFPGHAVRIVDEFFNDVPERQVGAIVARGPSVMQGYYDDPEATAEALRDGWLLTGDLGYIADGALYVCGRTKDLIIRQGRKYHPPDIESSLSDLQGVTLSGVVVFAVSRVEDTDEVVAVLETRASGRGEEIEEAVRRRVRETAGLEIDRVVLTAPGTIPRTTSGKVRRSETRDRLEAGTLVR